MTLAEPCVLIFALYDLREIVTEHMTRRILRFYKLHTRTSF